MISCLPYASAHILILSESCAMHEHGAILCGWRITHDHMVYVPVCSRRSARPAGDRVWRARPRNLHPWATRWVHQAWSTYRLSVCLGIWNDVWSDKTFIWRSCILERHVLKQLTSRCSKNKKWKNNNKITVNAGQVMFSGEIYYYWPLNSSEKVDKIVDKTSFFFA